jgi:hypothetical protein
LNDSMSLGGVAGAENGNEADLFDDFCSGLRHFALHCNERRLIEP